MHIWHVVQRFQPQRQCLNYAGPGTWPPSSFMGPLNDDKKRGPRGPRFTEFAKYRERMKSEHYLPLPFDAQMRKSFHLPEAFPADLADG